VPSGGKRKQTEKRYWSKKNGVAIVHGLYNSYRVHGCGCNECWHAVATRPAYVLAKEIGRASSDKAWRERQKVSP